MKIGLFLSDNQFIEGVLLEVKQDHLVVNVNQNVFYFALQHIQALSKNAKDFRVSSEIVHYVDKSYLVDVLKALRYNWVSINSMSDQAHLGVLSRISDDHITVINNSELLYIPKSSVFTINSNISEDQIILINKQEQLEIQDCQIEDQIPSEDTQKTKESERLKIIEVPILEKSAGEVTNGETVTNEKPEAHSDTKVEIYATLLTLLKHNLLNRDKENERREGIIQETAIQDVISDIDDESVGNIDSEVEEPKELQVGEQVPIEHTQTIVELKAPILEDSVGRGMEFETVTDKESEVSSQTESSEVPNLSRLVNKDLLKRVNEYSLGVEQQDLLETTNSVSRGEQFHLTESKVKRKKKRLLLTAWSTMNDDEHVYSNQNDISGKNELSEEMPWMERIYLLMVIQPLNGQNSEDFGVLEKLPECVETNNSHIPVKRIGIQ